MEAWVAKKIDLQVITLKVYTDICREKITTV